MNARSALALSAALILSATSLVQAHGDHPTTPVPPPLAQPVPPTTTMPDPVESVELVQSASTHYSATLNGKKLPMATLVADRLYVPAGSFAAAVGGTIAQDAQGVTRIDLPSFTLPTLAELAEWNPALTKYQPLSPYIPGMGIHMGVQGPGLIVATSKEGTVNAVEVLLPAQEGWQPWFDQPKEQPMPMDGLGEVYSQHIYVTDPDGLVEQNTGEPVLISGRYLSTDYALKAHRLNDILYIPLRPAVELLGGTINWDGATKTATAEVSFKGISYAWLKELNPALTKYQPISEFVPGMGVHNGVPGPHVTLLTDSAEMLVGFELVVQAAAGWAPWFDQPEGQSMELPGLGQVYTQHLYIVDPASIK